MPKRTKNDRVLAAFLEGKSYNRFEAERLLHDHCLHSTVSTLQKKHGFRFERLTESVPGFMGIPTRCCRYWIPPETRQRLEARKAKAPKSDQTRGDFHEHE